MGSPLRTASWTVAHIAVLANTVVVNLKLKCGQSSRKLSRHAHLFNSGLKRNAAAFLACGVLALQRVRRKCGQLSRGSWKQMQNMHAVAISVDRSTCPRDCTGDAEMILSAMRRQSQQGDNLAMIRKKGEHNNYGLNAHMSS